LGIRARDNSREDTETREKKARYESPLRDPASSTNPDISPARSAPKSISVPPRAVTTTIEDGDSYRAFFSRVSVSSLDGDDAVGRFKVDEVLPLLLLLLLLLFISPARSAPKSISVPPRAVTTTIEVLNPIRVTPTACIIARLASGEMAEGRLDVSMSSSLTRCDGEISSLAVKCDVPVGVTLIAHRKPIGR
jgi:hypothetical protein